MRAFFYGVICAFFIGVHAHATIVKLGDLHTMAKQSDIVVHGYVGEQEVVTDELGRLITLSKVAVIDGLHGVATGDVITVRQVGGQGHGVVMPILGGQSYSVGQEIFFFGLKTGQEFVSYGAGQGKLDVVHVGNEDLVVEDLGDVGALMNSAHGLTVGRAAALNFPSSAVFKDEVKLMLKAR